ncbi:MAG: sigma-70 family RNA polymerase sigma factor [Bacteroidia bacterium]|jgi:RNA polymerase sigma-70 factor (ECF subfamily)|tara:strand:+ start:4430 stop:5014 length:585 start_codon:yes stop_codon:yes gene_type:complete
MEARKLLDSHSAISQWLAKYGDDMYSWAFYKTSSKETAEDLVQDTMVSAFKSYEKYKPGSNPKTWLYTILNNKIIDYYRASNTQKSVNQTTLQGKNMDDDNFDSNGLWNKVQDPLWANTEEHLLDNPLFLKVLAKCIDNLPANWKGVMVGKYIDHKKGSEICKDLGISPSNLWQIAHRAKQQLRICLNQNWKDN